MKTHLFTLILITLFWLPTSAQPGGNSNDPDNTGISLDISSLNVSLFEGDLEKRTITIDNSSSNDIAIGLSLNNTSHHTASNEEFLIPPRIFSVDDFFGSSAEERDPATGYRSTLIVLPKNGHDFSGLAFDGEFLYFSTSSNPGTIYKQIPQFKNNLVDSIYSPILATVRVSGLTYSGNFLYATSVDTSLIYQIDLNTGDLIDQFAIDGKGLGIAFGGNRGTLFALTSNTEIIEINLATKEIINRLPSPRESKGLAYSNGLERLFVGEVFYNVYGIDPDDGSQINFYEDFTNALTADETFGLKWLDFPSVTIDVPAQSSVQYELSFNASDLEPGTYNTTVRLALNDQQGSTIDLPIELEVSPIIRRLSVETFCSVSSSGQDVWKIHNPNNFEVDATWKNANKTFPVFIRLQPGENVLLTDRVVDANGELILQWKDERNRSVTDSTARNGVTCDIRGLTLQAVCTENKNTSRQWEIINPNLFPVDVDWQVPGSSRSGNLQAESGTTLLTTTAGSAEENYTLQILWNTEDGQIKRQSKFSSNTPCIRGLTLTSVCTDDVDGRKKWEIFNPNVCEVEASWEMEMSDLGNTLIASPGVTFFYSAALPDNQVVKLTWTDEDGNIKRQRKEAQFGACDSSNSLARSSSEDFDSENSGTSGLIKETAVFPNPFDQKLSIRVNIMDNPNYRLTLYDMVGNVVYTGSGKAILGQSIIEINTSTLPQGTYILNVSSGGNIYRSKLIKN